MEIYMDIPGWNGLYQVSNIGNVRRTKKLMQYPAFGIITPKKHRQGYLEVRLGSGVFRKCILIHRLVMLAFVGKPPEGMEVNHKNGKKQDNCLENLEYVTPKANTKHAICVLGRTGPRGELSGRRKLTWAEVRNIRLSLKNGVSASDLSRQYNVTKTNIYDIKSGKSWKEKDTK